jgi:hypothetical protein
MALASPEVIPEGSYRLEIDSYRNVSLTANEAHLNEIFSRLGRELDIEVNANLPDDPRVTMEFMDQPLPEALKQMAESYMLVTDDVDGRVIKIFVLPKGDGAYEPTSPVPTTEKGAPRDTENAAFQFEFDAAAVPVEDETVPAEEGPPD